MTRSCDLFPSYCHLFQSSFASPLKTQFHAAENVGKGEILNGSEPLSIVLTPIM